MAYRFLEEIATADVAFEATGNTLEELFTSAADATMNVMVDDLGTIERKEEISFEISNPELDMLLFNFLNELIYLKDARKLLLRIENLAISEHDSLFTLHAAASGERLEAKKHRLKVDVKAATLHRLGVFKTPEGWRATAVLDI